MNDPLQTVGLRGAVILAGFAGGLVALQDMQGVTRWKVVSALFTSLAVAGYGTPLVAQWLNISPGPLRYSIAFVLGLCAMRIVPLLLHSVPVLWKRFIIEKSGDDHQGDAP